MTQEIADVTIALYDEVQATKGATGDKAFAGPGQCGSFDFVALNHK